MSDHNLALRTTLQKTAWKNFVKISALFSCVGKIPDDQEFYFLLTIPDFADKSDICQSSVPDFRQGWKTFAHVLDFMAGAGANGLGTILNLEKMAAFLKSFVWRPV